jgi:hypothetical protein
MYAKGGGIMKKRTKWLIAAVSLILVGGILFTGVMTVLQWNFRKLSTDQYETNTYNITDAFTNISVDVTTADVVFAPSADGTASVVCYEEIQAKHKAEIKAKEVEKAKAVLAAAEEECKAAEQAANDAGAEPAGAAV